MRKIGNYTEIRNPDLKLLVEIANSLYIFGKVNSYRDFSRRYLNRTSNYMNVLFYNPTKNPSIAVLLRLYQRLRVNKSFKDMAENLRIHIGNRMLKQYL